MNLPTYSATGDIITVILCVICWLFLKSTYTTKQANFRLFYMANTAMCIAATCHSFLNLFLRNIQADNVAYIYILHDIIYICLASVLLFYCLYLGNLFTLQKTSMHKLYAIIFPAFVIFILYKLISPTFNQGFYIDENLNVHYNYTFNAFICYYIYVCGFIICMTYKLRKRLVQKTRTCLQGVVSLSFLVMFLGYIFNSSSFVCVTFMFPIVAVLFFFHYNAFDVVTGTLDLKSFNNYVKDLRHKPFGMFCLYLKNYSLDKYPHTNEQFAKFTEKLFHNDYCMFRISDERFILIYRKHHISSDESLINAVFAKFKTLYHMYHIPFKLLYIYSDRRLTDGEDYLVLSKMLHKRMDLNTFHICQEDDIENFLSTKSVHTVLQDICTEKDFDDPRVKVYCQPILDTETNTFKNAEVLMRIESDGVMFTPDIFIPLAEHNGYIHILSKIILHKTCKAINELLDEGYQFDRISINFSTIDFKEKEFYKEILEIIQSNGTPADKLAIEITETEDETEYRIINKSIRKLKDKGIKFYLDDFGTGYSNFQRTFTLPVDIIKFDRSITTLACQNPETYGMVKKFSKMLSDFGYKILFEGVETIEEEVRCREMSTHYLQGYNYSAPVEVGNLRNYFTKTN